MNVTIMYRNSFVGGDGWTYHPMNIVIADNCPVCGGKRGEPIPRNFCEDGEWYVVDTWINSCGHLDKYKDCYFEAQKIKNDRQEIRSTN